MFLFCEKLLMKIISKNERKLVEERRALFNISEEGISGFRDIAGYNYIEKYLKHIDGQFEYFLKQVKKGKTYENINYVLAAFFKWLNLILGLSILYFNTSNKDISVGVFFAAYQYINQYSNLICNLGANIKAINSVIVRRNKIQSDINSIDVIDANKGIELNSKIENIEIKNVRFSYPDTNQQMYFNNYIEIGKKNIIIGESGKGKTTFIKLLLKYYTISSGEIIINEMYNLKDIAYESWISKICVVNQEPYIYNDTIKNNITLGRKICDDEIKKVCDCVMLTEYIESLSGGINTMIGENGVNISGGQKQRIAIARALLQKTEIIIMDEALSALDIANQQAIQNNIDQLKKGITQLIITHQLLEQDDAHIIEI